jgi:hypothetical protein
MYHCAQGWKNSTVWPGTYPGWELPASASGQSASVLSATQRFKVAARHAVLKKDNVSSDTIRYRTLSLAPLSKKREGPPLEKSG